MKTVAMENMTLTAEELAAMAQKEPVILTRKGHPVAAVKDLRGSDWESVSLANNPKFIELIEASRRSYRKQGGIGLEEIRQQFGLRAKAKVGGKRPGRKKSRQ